MKIPQHNSLTRVDYSSTVRSLSLATHTSCSLFLIFLFNIFLAAFLTSVDAFSIKIVQHVPVALRPLIYLAWKNTRQHLQLFLAKLASLGHLDMEIDD